MKTSIYTQNEKTSLYTAVASLAASVIAGAACIGPLIGIMLGVGSLGWLSSYAYLTLPASIVSILLLAAAFYIYQKRKSSCADRRKHRIYRGFLIVIAITVIGINSFEFIILPNLI